MLCVPCGPEAGAGANWQSSCSCSVLQTLREETYISSFVPALLSFLISAMSGIVNQFLFTLDEM